MSNILIVSEKPSSAQKIASALGSVSKKAGYFEVKRGGDIINVAPAVGHLYTLVQKEKSNSYPIFDLKWVTTPEASEHFAYAEKYISVLKKLARTANEVIVACDYDVEGELIGYNIWRFMAPKLPAKRMKFSTLTNDELVDAFEHASAVPVNTAIAGETRHFLDWYFGINLSRALMASIKAAGRFKIMSIGRVQGPALAILAQREKEIAAFIPVPYWQLFADIENVQFVHEKDRFTDKATVDKILATTPKDGKIAKVERLLHKLPPPNPHDLTTLQVEAYGAFGFTPAKTLELAQYLYENAYISYPRTSSQQLPEQLNLKKIVTQLTKQPQYASDANKILKTSLKPNNGKKTDAAHPAIHPTGNAPLRLGEQHAKLYDLIVRNFLACFAQPCEREKVNVTAQLGNEKFKAGGSRTISQGWLEFLPYNDVKDTVINFTEGAKVHADKIYVEAKETQPPKRYSPASIVRKLEDLELGTKATRAEVIETLYSRDYIADKKSIHTTQFGMCVYDALVKHCPDLLKEDLTRDFEKEMELIEEGKVEPSKVISRAEVTITKLSKDFKQHELEIGKLLLTALNTSMSQAAELGACKCGSKLLIRRSRFGQFVGCAAYPNCKVTFPLPHKAFIVPSEKVCPKCNTPIIGVRRKAKKFFSMCLDPKCETKASWGNKSNSSGASSVSSASGASGASGSSVADGAANKIIAKPVIAVVAKTTKTTKVSKAVKVSKPKAVKVPKVRKAKTKLPVVGDSSENSP